MSAVQSPVRAPEPEAVRVPGDLLLGAVPLLAVGVLVLNDQVLKAAWPGFVTGKLSDAAGLVFFPFLLTGAWELVRRATGRPGRATLLVPIVAIAATGVVFTLVKVAPWAGDAYRAGLGVIQWPFSAIGAVFSGAPVRPPAPVVLIADPSDLAMVPALALPLGMAIVARPPDAATWRLRRDLAVSGLALAMFVGAVVDGWAHTHLAATLESVLTPWHAIVYTSFALLVAILAADVLLTARSRPDRWSGRTLSATVKRLTSLIPTGYGPTVLGAAVFIAAGMGDTLWHVAFGIEANAEALVSPTHLLLGVGAGLIAAGPARSTWLLEPAPRWPAFLPAALAIGTVAGLVGFATQFASPFVDAWPSFPSDSSSSTYWAIAPIGMAAVALQSGVVAGALATVLRVWPRPPSGALAIVVLVGVAPLAMLHDHARLAVAAAAGAIVAEAMSATGLRRGWTTANRLRVVATVTPAVMWAAVIGVLAAGADVVWSAHLIGGGFVVAMTSGALVGVVTTLPASPEAG